MYLRSTRYVSQREPVWQISVKHFLVIYLLKSITFSLQLMEQNSFIKILSKTFHQHSVKRSLVELCICSGTGCKRIIWNWLGGQISQARNTFTSTTKEHQRKWEVTPATSQNPWTQSLNHCHIVIPVLDFNVSQKTRIVSPVLGPFLHIQHTKYNADWETTYLDVVTDVS